MGSHRICCVCLIQGTKMYNCNEFFLKSIYEDLIAEKMSDELPQYFCYECAAMLFKFHKFKQKCYTGLTLLKDVLKYGAITPYIISKFNRKKCELKSSIGILKVNRRVKFCSIKHKYSLEEASQPQNEENIENVHSLENDKLNEENQTIHDKLNEENQTIHDRNDNNSVEINDKTTTIDETEAHMSDDDDLFEEKNEIESIPEAVAETDNEITNTEFNLSDSDSENLPLAVHQKAKTVNISKEVCNEKEKGNIQNSNNETGTIKKAVKKKKGNSKKLTTNEVITVKNKKKPKFEFPKQEYLKPEYWKKSLLTEEEAMAEFHAKGKDRKYLEFPFKCESCYKGFSKLDIKERHMKLAHCESRGSFICRFCKSRYRIKCHLSRHLQLHYERYKCLRCDFVCNYQHWAQSHNNLHSGIMSTCTHCGLQFAHVSTYYTHLRIYHRSEHVCRVCGESFVSQKGLTKHTKIKHLFQNDLTKDNNKNTFCKTCDIQFETQGAYEEHFNQSAKHAPDDLKDKRTISELEKLAGVSLKRLGETKKTCFMCALSFRYYADFVKHHLSEHKDVPMDMPTIQKIQTRIKDKIACPNVVCEICGVSLKAQSMMSHMNAKHTRKQLFPCTNCGREFTSKMILQRHFLVHTGEKPHKCTLCEKRFTQKGSMQLHYRTFHLKEAYPKRNRNKWKETE